MADSEIRIEPLNPIMGAEVQGVDLSSPLSPPLLKELRAAWLKHQVLFFRDQHLTKEQHKTFGRLWGTLHVHPAAPAPKGHPELLIVHADENSKTVAGYGWHSDVSCDEAPPMASILRLEEVPPDGAGTRLRSGTIAVCSIMPSGTTSLMCGTAIA